MTEPPTMPDLARYAGVPPTGWVLGTVTDRPLSEILVKYRAMVHAQRAHKRLQVEVARMFAALNADQQVTYIEACERIETEEREAAG
jgi:hypothetical protein